MAYSGGHDLGQADSSTELLDQVDQPVKAPSTQYDVFVSYSHIDSDWVLGWLVPGLRAVGLTVCLDREAFDIGVPAIRNMERAVASSRHTLLVLTPAWIASRWTELEAILSYDVRNQRTLPLLYKPCTLPPSIDGLSRADFVNDPQSDAELAKVIDAVRGVRRLGEEPVSAAVWPTVDSEVLQPVVSDYGGSSLSARAGRGFKALAELMQMPEVQTAVAEYRTSFEAVCTQIAVLGDYKDLHDLLHMLQFQLYQPLVAQLRIAPDADVFVYLWDYVGLIPELVEQMTLVIERRQVAQQESSWVEGLAQVGELFQHAVQNEKAEELKILNRRLKEILGRQPFRINMRLNESARGLRLLGLINAIAWLSDYLTLHAIDPQKVSLIEESVSAIRRLDASLGVLTVAHDQWQTLEEDLRKIEVALETQSDLSELVWSWPSVKKQTSSLCHANTEKWALALTDSMWKLEVALEADNPPLIRRTFPVFRSGAGRRFHQVDHDLKELCDRLREIGESLRVVLKMIQ